MKCFLLCSKVMLRVALFLLIGWAALTPARADNLYARIHGTVTDSSGAVVPEVTVIAFNNGTGLVRTVSSDANGNFEFIQLPIGTYRISASKNGLSLLVSYTYAHSLAISSSFENADLSGTSLGTNPFNPRLDYADSLFDVRQRLVTSFTYKIPNFSHVRGLGWLPDRQRHENHRINSTGAPI